MIRCRDCGCPVEKGEKRDAVYNHKFTIQCVRALRMRFESLEEVIASIPVDDLFQLLLERAKTKNKKSS